MPAPRSRLQSLLWVALSYVLAILVGSAVGWALRNQSLYLSVGLADLAATVVVFGFSLVFDNSSFYDLYWSVAPMAIALGLFLYAPHDGAPPVRRILALAMVWAWGARLSWIWLRSWPGIHHEDWRYVDMRNKTGSRYWIASFFGLHLVPTIITYLGGLAFIPVFASGRDTLNVLDILAVAVCTAAVLLETVADEQLRSFRKENATPGTIMAKGLWAYCRHPNYLGEMSVWWGFFLFALGADAGSWWTVVGPLSVTGLVAGVSVRMIDERNCARRPAYAEHMKRVPAFIPRLPK